MAQPVASVTQLGSVCCGCCALQAVMRGPSYVGGDAVEEAVMAMVRKDVDEDEGAGSSGSNKVDNASAAAAGSRGGFDIATATSWPGVPAGDVLVAPHEARLAWREFMSASSLSVQQVRMREKHVGAAGVTYHAGRFAVLCARTLTGGWL